MYIFAEQEDFRNMNRSLLTFFLAFLMSVSFPSRSKMTYDNDRRLGFHWTPAAGDVDHYNVYIEDVDIGTVTVLMDAIKAAPTSEDPYFVDGEAGKTYRLQVEADDGRGNKVKSDWSEPVMCTPGDVNYDGRVNIADLILVARNLMSKDNFADINDDGMVNPGDLGVLVKHWDRIYYENHPPSEPSATMLRYNTERRPSLPYRLLLKL